jgi:hypothetical protein
VKVPVDGEWAGLEKSIKANRQSGQVIVSLVGRTEPAPDAAASSAVHALGLKPVSWRVLSADEAVHALRRALHRDLAYDAPIMPEELAHGLASRIVRFFGPGAIFYTNRSLAEGQSTGSWEPVTDATFDTGVIAVGIRCVGVVWFMDEH